MPYDYTDAPPPQFDLIPQGTIATVSTHIRPGNAGDGGTVHSCGAAGEVGRRGTDS
jgi:hypothetical protein